MDSRDSDIAAKLKAELDEANRENIAASAEFNSIMKDIPSGIPQPDGNLRIRQAAAKMNAAVQKHLFALKRYTDFVVRGVSPEDGK